VVWLASLQEEVAIEALHVSITSFHFNDQPRNTALDSTQFIATPRLLFLLLLHHHHLLTTSSCLRTQQLSK
jgi:hypothetical protein